jgi:hypothetical protein
MRAGISDELSRVGFRSGFIRQRWRGTRPGIACSRQSSAMRNESAELSLRAALSCSLGEQACREAEKSSAAEKERCEATPQPQAQRQATPHSTNGILSNNNVRLDERIDLLDFLENEIIDGAPFETAHVPLPGTMGAVKAPARPVSATRGVHALPKHTALQLALEMESNAALAVLTDDVPPAAPCLLQPLICLCFASMGVESTMRTVCPLMPEPLRERVSTCLATIERAGARVLPRRRLYER